MAGENKPAIEMRNKLTKYVTNYINNTTKYFYPELCRNINAMLNDDPNVTYYKANVDYHVLYIRWQFKTSAQMLTIVVDLKDIKHES